MSRTLEQIISLPAYLTYFPLIPTLTHWEMVKRDCYVKKLKRATYQELKEKLLSVEWSYDPSYPTSLFDNSGKNYFHASIFRFGDVGYLLTPYGYLMASLLQRKIRKQLPGYRMSIKPYVK